MQKEVPATTSSNYDFSFTGEGSEYFRIWIVNLLLSIITLGIYSAWAKVRTKRYFYGNTFLDNTSFDYLANPVTILKGRLIAVALLALYMTIASMAPGMEGLFLIVLFLLSPWLIIKALAFNAQNSAYRNIRFNFDASLGQAVKEYILFPILILFTVGLIFPYINFRQSRFTIDHHLFGQHNFQFSSTAGQFYKIYGIALLMLFVAGIITSILMGGLMAFSVNDLEETQQLPPSMMYAMFAFYFIYAVVAVYMQVKLLNLVYNNTSLDDIQLHSNFKVGKMLWLHVSNLFGIILTLGLFYPWAKVRMARYRVEQLALQSNTDLNQFTAGQISTTKATGEEIGEVFALDIGI